VFDCDCLEVLDSFVEIPICVCNFLSKAYRMRHTIKVFKGGSWTGWRFDLTTRLRKLAKGVGGHGALGILGACDDPPLNLNLRCEFDSSSRPISDHPRRKERSTLNLDHIKRAVHKIRCLRK
jgi:hypothetical protein